MKRSLICAAVIAAMALGQAGRVRADEIPPKYLPHIEKGLKYLVDKQFKDGHWGANGDNYPVSMTALAGVAMLMEGSTVREGKYAPYIRKAVDWLMDRAQKGGAKEGLVGNPDHPTETGRYMYGHGFATMFLALAYGEEDDKERREKMKEVLKKAVLYIGAAQSTQGGWFYTSAKEGHDQDEGSVTVTQMQALRAARNAGIPVPKAFVQKGADYLRKSTAGDGGVVYSLGRGGVGAPLGGGRPALTAAAIACLFYAGEYTNEHVLKWFKFCMERPETRIAERGKRFGHDEYIHFYYAQAVYQLGDDWDAKFDPKNKMRIAEKDKITWNKYREDMFEYLAKIQAGDGSWSGGGGFSVGPVYSTAIYCTILQLDRGAVPFFAK